MGANRSIVSPSPLSLMGLDAFCVLKRAVMAFKIDYTNQKASAHPFMRKRYVAYLRLMAKIISHLIASQIS